ncbi:MAG: hypothetical protein MUO40_14660 [Anaerolineaceae bacterium]|nr:hypothetical protein [Anaerolineaceae bacterium]
MTNNLPIPKTGRLSLLLTSSNTNPILVEIIAELALKRKLLVLDGGNRFDGYGLAHALRRHTINLDDALKNILLSRTFTCYQLTTLLSDLTCDNTPIVVLDILSTFLDENVNLEIRHKLLSSCLTHLQRLSQTAPVVVWARTRSLPGIEDEGLMEELLKASDKIWYTENPQPATKQLSLFNLPSPHHP